MILYPAFLVRVIMGRWIQSTPRLWACDDRFLSCHTEQPIMNHDRTAYELTEACSIVSAARSWIQWRYDVPPARAKGHFIAPQAEFFSRRASPGVGTSTLSIFK